MLEAMRKGSQNFLVKVFLFILAASFVVWGIGDVFRGGSATTVATIGEEEIGYSEYSSTLQREISRFQQIMGSSLTEEQIAQFDIRRRVLEQLIDSKLIRIRVNDLNLKVGDDVARKQLVSNSLFFGDNGSFSSQHFKNILRSNGLNENDYISALKQDTAVRMLINTIGAAPSSLENRTKALYRYRNEYRIADLVVIPSDYIKEVEEPSETDLIQYYQEHTDDFSVLETREVTYLLYGFEDVKNSVQVSEEALKSEYDSNIKSFTDPEKRDVVQYLFESETDANSAVEEIKAGKDAAYKDKKIELGQVTHDSLPDEVKITVFDLKQNEYSKPVESSLGWHIFTVNKIIEPQARPFEDVRKELEDYLKEAKASEVFEDSYIKIEDEFAAGATLEDVAKKFDVVIHKVPAINKDAQGASGKVLTNIPDPQTFVETAFYTESNEVSPMTLLSDNASYLVLRVDGVTPKRIKALDEVRGTVISLWKEEKRKVKLAEFAKEIADKIKSGQEIAEISRAMKLKLKEDEKINRPVVDLSLDSENELPVYFSSEIFSIKRGESTSYHLSSNGDYIIGKLKDIKDVQFDKKRLSSLERSLKKDFTDDILQQYNYFLRKEYPVTKNETLLNSSNL